MINIIYHDKDIILCEKPIGTDSEAPGLPDELRARLGGEVFCVHRLDKAVGGLMVYARSSRAAASLSRQIAEHKLIKEYLAAVSGTPEQPAATLTDLLFKDSAKNKSYVVTRPRRGVKEASLEYTTIASGAGLSLLRIRLHTGRSHQIRVQFSSRGLPLAGDVKYGSKIKDCPIALWSHRLSFAHPRDGRAMDFSLPAPGHAPWNIFPKENES